MIMIFGGTINAMVTILAHGVVNPKKGANVMEICRRRVKEAVMVFGVTAMVMRPHPRLPQVHHPRGGGLLQQPDTGIVQEELVGVRTFLLRATLINQLIATGSLLPSLCRNVFHSPYSLTHIQTSNAMFEAPPNNAYWAKFYGTAAVSPALFGGSEWLWKVLEGHRNY